jgi:D-lactate dehydrogenase
MNIANAAFHDGLRDIVGTDNLLTDPADCWTYGYDNSRRHSNPEVVAFITHHDQVRDCIRQCNEYQVPVVPRGRGTGTTGGSVPLAGGLVLALERMDRILKIAADDRLLIAEPGVINSHVQQVAAQHGFFWPPDPTSADFCTIGGNLAYNSAGPRAIKYGTPRENTLGLRAVTGAGEEIRTGVYTTKGVVGYDLTRLLIGSEGTLAIITEATLQLTPLPEVKHTLRALYRDTRSAAEAIARTMAQAVIPCALEFMDGRALNMVRDYAKTSLPNSAGALLLIEVDGPRACIEGAVEAVTTTAHVDGLVDIRAASTEQEVTRLWEIRRALSPALRNIAPKKINEDVVVPVSKIPDLIAELETLSRRYSLPIINFGHAGNGNIHVNLLVDPDDPTQMDRARRCLGDVFDLVLTLDGTLSGEHGVGIEKRDFIAREVDPATLALMRRIKDQFDPRHLLNPHKVFPE